MTRTLQYHETAARPSAQLWLEDADGTLVDLSSGFTFSLKIGHPGSDALLTKTTGITGAAGSGAEPDGTPNCTVAWTAGELAGLDPGVYDWQLTATTGGLPRVWSGVLEILAAIT
jgi:hypothetical protein